ncbi:MAG TPA: hypothetical protein VFF40_01155 [Acidimicrobiia bacterium]|nr:hypothetical protein [Acidimicrobiia bacterium]
MDVKKSIQDAGYIAVGAGVIGFQQAQVRRRELTSRLVAKADAARTRVHGSVGAAHGQITDQVGQTRGQITDQVGQARDQVTDQAGLVRDQISTSVGSTAGTAWDVASSAAWEVATGLSGRATGLADDIREWVDPAVGELKIRVEPLGEQLQTVPGQLSRVMTAGPGRVLTLVRSEPAA